MIQIDFRDPRPIYEQVRDGLRHLVVSGAIEPGEKLPSVRALAASLAINPNTIQKAYEALEMEGYVCSIPGKGSFAAPGTQVDERRREQLLEQVWGFDFFGDSRTVDVHIKRLREKLQDSEALGWTIRTVWGVGYKFEVK